MNSRFWCILLSASLVFVFSGCAEKQVKTVEMDKQAAVEKETAAVKQTAAAKEEPAVEKVASARPAAESGAGTAADGKETGAADKKGAALDTYVVKKGDCLWRIAGCTDVYGDPYLWPVIFDANKKKIKNPNRIYPGQELKIPRAGLSMDAVKKVRKKAGAPKPYTPPADAKAPIS